MSSTMMKTISHDEAITGRPPVKAADWPNLRAACYPGHWVGRFIWDAGESLPYNYHLMFRKTIELADDPKNVRIHITAALKYKLWINGSYHGTGPARSLPEWKSFDTHDLSNAFVKGRNSIAVLCWFTGVPNNYSSDERAGLWAQLEYLDIEGQPHIVGTDATWRVQQARGFSRKVKHYRGIAPEVYDSRLDPADWMMNGFDDSTWDNATCLVSGEYRCDPTMLASWTHLEPRQTPLMRESEVKAVKLAFVGEADARFYPNLTDTVERMAGQELFPLQHARAEHCQSLIETGGPPAVFSSDTPCMPEASLTNLLANRPCHVFGPIARATPPSSPGSFKVVPSQMTVGATRLERQEGRCSPMGEIDLAPFIDGTAEGKTAYVYVPFEIEKEGLWTVGAGADWWMECHLDGEKLFDTNLHGNGFHPPHFSNFRKTLALAKGTHLLAARVTSGALGSVFACGVVPVDASGSPSRDPFITLDFGRTYNAFPSIEFEAPAGAVIEISTGGQVLPDGRVSWGPDPNWSRPAVCIAAGGRQRWKPFEPVPVRFLQVVFRNLSQPIKVFDVKLVSWEYPAEKRGSFACSDHVLTTLWQAGVETAYLHMDDSLIFDVIRERAAWTLIGEAEQGHLALATAYGDLPFTRWHMKQTLRSQLPSGLFQIVMGSHASRNDGFPKPTTPSSAGNAHAMVNHFPFIAHAIRNHYWHFGDGDILKEWYPALTRLADWYIRNSDDQGLLYNLPGQPWFDWVSEQELHGAHFESNAIYCRMLTCLGEIAGWLGLPAESERWFQRADKVRHALRMMHWNEKRGLFCDSVIDGTQSRFFTELANGMALLYDIADQDQKRKIVNALTRDGNGCTQVTILYFYYLIEGLIKANAVDEAITRLSAANRDMLALSDPPTFWEEWPNFKTTHRAGNSPLHFGGAGVVRTLATHVLGVQPAAPGFTACRIHPRCGTLAWAKGVVPSARGDVHMEWRRGDNIFMLSVFLPQSMPTEIVLPFNANANRIINHNGTRYTCDASNNMNDAITWSDQDVTIRVNGGRHTFEIPG